MVDLMTHNRTSGVVVGSRLRALTAACAVNAMGVDTWLVETKRFAGIPTQNHHRRPPGAPPGH